MVRFIDFGDIFAISDVKNFAHGCNCAGAMGKGIAVQFKMKFPEMYKEYKHLCKTGKYNPGDVYAYRYSGGYVYNLATQTSWKTCAKLEYIEEAIGKMLVMAREHGVKSIAMPAIGAGLGGLNWKDVKDVICGVASGFDDVILYVVEEYCQ